MRATLAVIAGILAGMAAMMAVSFVGSLAFPIVAPPTPGGAIEQATAAFAHAPMGLKLFYVLAWFVGGLVAGVVAKLIVPSGRIAWTAIAILTALTALNMFVLPYPVWMEIANVLAPLLGGLVGNHLIAARADAPETQVDA
ncbi:hypothetical protein [Sphingosinicella sp.]|uniref:hypothetical protein n=1 Tax=Sphingosinicella sp. TaxID=1917971 RepID=UPI004037AC2A